MRTLNIIFVLVTAIACLGLYRIAEAARIARADLAATDHAIAQEHKTLVVLGAEWGRVTEPARIAALAQRHLALADMPAVTLSSLTSLPRKDTPLSDAPMREAKATISTTRAEPLKVVAFRTGM